ncbi:MAG: biopolymer transporter ExbD [Treponema sp.]|nr:biopolymer transporter ExbD [Treponema sp.]
MRARRRSRFAEFVVASDLAFLLVMYFLIVGIGSGGMAAIEANLAGASSESAVGEILRFEMDGEGKIFFDSLQVEAAEARALILAAQGSGATTAVTLAVDPLARWQDVVSFVDLAREQNVETFSFALRQGASQ